MVRSLLRPRYTNSWFPQFEVKELTQLLEKAYSEAAQLPENAQDAIAAIILDTIADEALWSRQFAATQDGLARLAEEALAEHRAGKTLLLYPNAL